MQKQKYQAYAAATQTVAKTQQIIMLYDGVIRFMQQAREAVRNKRIEGRYNALTRASEIIMGLQSCLDFENGGDIARVLYHFYSGVDGRIFSVHRTGSAETCDEVIEELKRMRDVWQDIDRQTSGGDAAAVPSAALSVPVSPEQNVTLSA